MKYLKIIILSIIIIIIIILAVIINMLRNSDDEISKTNTTGQTQTEEAVEDEEEPLTLQTLINEQRNSNIIAENNTTATNTVSENVTPETNTEEILNNINEEDQDTPYEQATVEDKVEINIRKFIDAINTKNYNTAYSYLAASFKKSNMNTVEEFKKIAQKYFWEQNDFIMGDVEELGNNIYRSEIVVTNPKGSYTDEMDMTVTMQLKEGQNFIMQFTRPEPTEITKAP